MGTLPINWCIATDVCQPYLQVKCALFDLYEITSFQENSSHVFIGKCTSEWQIGNLKSASVLESVNCARGTACLASSTICAAQHTDRTLEPGYPKDWRAKRELDLLKASQPTVAVRSSGAKL